jgi:hypothetical protein
MGSEKPPVDKTLNVLDHTTIYKTDDWWAAVCLVESFGRKQISLYLWQKKGDAWKRKHKFVVRSNSDWNLIKQAVEKFLGRL